MQTEAKEHGFQEESAFAQLKFKEHMANIQMTDYQVIDIRLSKLPDNDLNTVAVIGYYTSDSDSEQTYGYYLRQMGDAFDIKAEGREVDSRFLKNN